MKKRRFAAVFLSAALASVLLVSITGCQASSKEVAQPRGDVRSSLVDAP